MQGGAGSGERDGDCRRFSTLFGSRPALNPPASISLSAQWEANCRAPLAASQTKRMGRSRLVYASGNNLRRGRFRDSLPHPQRYRTQCCRSPAFPPEFSSLDDPFVAVAAQACNVRCPQNQATALRPKATCSATSRSPSVQQTVVTLERNGLIRRQPGVARSIELHASEEIPILKWLEITRSNPL